MKKIILTVIFCLLTTSLSIAGNWKIEKVEKKKSDREAYYSVTVSPEQCHWPEKIDLEERDLDVLKDFFKSDDIVGKTFFSTNDEGGKDLLDLVYNDGVLPWTKIQIFEEIAKALSEMREPVYPRNSKIEKTLFDAFIRTWDTGKEAWIESLKKRINILSDGQTELIEANPDSFQVHYSGPAGYFFLKSKSKGVKKVVIMPCNRPVTFGE